MPILSHTNNQLVPKNTQTVDVAKSAIADLSPLIKQQYENSLSVVGYPALVYSLMRTGTICSCTRGQEASPVLDLDGNASPEHIQEILSSSRFSIQRYGEIPSKSITLQTEALNTPVTTANNIGLDLESPVLTDVGYESNEDEIDFPLGAATSGVCAVCYGSGFVGGYQLHNGHRITLSTESQLVAAGVTVNALATPNKFEFTRYDSSLVFSVVLPKGAVSTDAIRVMNNNKVVSEYTLEIETNNIWTAYSSSVLLSACDGKLHGIKIRATTGFEFTHIEIQFNMVADKTLIEYPRLSKTGDLSVLDAIDPVSLNITSRVVDVKTRDIVVDTVLNKIWMITSVQHFNDNNLNNFGWDCQARLIQTYELQSLLIGRPTPNYNKPTLFNRPNI